MGSEDLLSHFLEYEVVAFKVDDMFVGRTLIMI